jgi:hypothetical protein
MSDFEASPGFQVPVFKVTPSTRRTGGYVTETDKSLTCTDISHDMRD